LIEIFNKQLLLQLVGYLCYWQMGFNSVFKGLIYDSSMNSANSKGEVKIASRKESINLSFFSANEIRIRMHTFIASFQMQLDVLSLECKQGSFFKSTGFIKMSF